MSENFYAVYPIQVEVSGEPGSYVVSDAPNRITGLLFEKSGVRVRVDRNGAVAEAIPEGLGDVAVSIVAAASGAFQEVTPGWGDVQARLEEQGFKYVGAEVVESLAVDLLHDGCQHAGRAMAARVSLDNAEDVGDQVDHRNRGFREYRQSVILLAAAAEAFINEFIALNLPNQASDLLHVRPPTAKWRLAVNLATQRHIHDEAPTFGDLEKLFALRNKVMHFSPGRRIQWAKDRAEKTKGQLRPRLRNEEKPMRHCYPVIDGAATLIRLGREKPVYSFPEVVKAAFAGTGAPQNYIEQLVILARPVPRVLRKPPQSSSM